MITKHRILTFALLIFAFAYLSQVDSAVIGLDLGTEYMKISSITPGKSFDIVEDTTSKRKTPTGIGFYSNERVYEYDIHSKRPRAFQTMFLNLPKFLGKSLNDTKLQEQIKYYLEDYQLSETDRGTIAFNLKNFKMGEEDETKYELKIEELFAMIFRHIKTLASKQAERQLRDIAVTIPPFWNLKERYALYDALLLADLNPLAFISENTAAALYYGLERQDSTPHRIILYNLGSKSLKVSLVEYVLQNSTEKGDKGASFESVKVLAEAWDEDLGGLGFDLNVLHHLVKEFDSKPARKGQKSLITSNPAKAKLLKETNRVKEILSANKQSQFYFENLFDSTDLKVGLERTKFEELNQDLFAKLTKPIDEVLEKAGLTIADIDNFEMIGGALRTPKVQQVLQEYLKGKDLSTHLNGDESMALGAAFHAANLSSSFKTRQVYLNDGYNYDIRVELKDLETERLESNDESTPSLDKKATLFPYKTRFGSKKILTFEYDGDINCTFIGIPSGATEEEALMNFAITGLKEARENPKFEGKDLNKPKVHLHFRLTPLGFIELTKAEATIEEIVLYEDKSASAKNTTTETPEPISDEKKETTGDEDSKDAQSETEDKATPTEPEKKFKKKTITHTIPLKVQANIPGFTPMTEEEREVSRDILSKFDHFEAQKRKTAEAKNKLEAFIYSTRDALEDEEFLISAQDEEKEQLKNLAEENSEWLYTEEASKSNHQPFQKRYDEMNKIYSKIQFRTEQRLKRSDVVEKARGILKGFIDKVNEVNATKTWITAEAISTAVEQIENINTWLTEQVEKQEALKANEDPVLTTITITSKLDKAKEIYTKLKNTQKPKPPKNGTNTEDFAQFAKDFTKDGKFDEEKFKEYMKKMNITYGDDAKKEKKEGDAEDIKNDQTEEPEPEAEPTDEKKDEEPTRKPDQDL